MYRIVLFDLDETLLTDEKTVLEENKRAIEEVNKLGVQTVICSGRQANAARAYKEMAGTGRYVICTNGTEIYDYEKNEEIYTCEMDKKSVMNLYQLANEYNLILKIDTPRTRYINDMSYARIEEKELTDSIETILNNNEVLQISLGFKDEEKIEEVSNIVEQDKLIKIENNFVQYNKENEKAIILNIINRESSKGNAILKLCEYLEVNIEDTIAFGDDINDYSMISTVGIGVAMSNAKEEIKKIAKEITLSNNEPGIAKVLREKIVDKEDWRLREQNKYM